jgi:uncharacterized membrane protein HdeD (DUF308 family)
MLISLARNWWVLLVRGLLAILFGVLALTRPGATLFALIVMFGAFTLVNGLLAIIAALLGRTEGIPWWALLVEGVFSVGVGIATLTWPGLTGMILLYMIAFWSIATGIFEIIAAIRLRQVITGELLLGFGGVLSILFGFLLLAYPANGALAVAWLIGIYAILFGGMLVALSSRLRGLWKRHQSTTLMEGH